jgi:3-hydroxy acid dehydrogenase/malonic semialdehyde reductase
VADTVHWVATRPAHMNVNVVEVMPVAQAFNLFKYDRKSG